MVWYIQEALLGECALYLQIRDKYQNNRKKYYNSFMHYYYNLQRVYIYNLRFYLLAVFSLIKENLNTYYKYYNKQGYTYPTPSLNCTRVGWQRTKSIWVSKPPGTCSSWRPHHRSS